MAEAKHLSVPGFLIDPTAGDLGIHVLAAVHEFLGNKVDYATLKAISGDGYKFVYDSGRVFEAMRDLTPTDFVRDGLGFYGAKGSWKTGFSVDECKVAIRASLDQGWPVITSNLADTQPGYQIIVGLDEEGESCRVAVQGGRDAQDMESDTGARVRWQRLDRDWDGPLSGRARWDINPLFVIETFDKAKPKKDEILDQAVAVGISVYERFEIPYGTSGLADAYADEDLAGRSASHGIDAWGRLAEDVAERPDLTDFAFLWKLDTVSSRLAHDRAALAEFFHAEGKRKRGDNAAALKDVAGAMEQVVAGAEELSRFAWFTSKSDVGTPEDFQQMMATTSALAYPVPQHRGFPDRLREMGYGDRIHRTLRGEAILMGDDVRWRSLARVVDKVADLETSIETALRRFSGG